MRKGKNKVELKEERTNMKNIELKTCPFCGQIPEILGEETDEPIGVHCLHCDYELGYFDTVEEAAEAWNTRKEQTQRLTLKEHICAVMEILDKMRKDINPYEITDITLRIILSAVDAMGIDIDTSCAKNSWFSPDAASPDKFKRFDISEERIVKYLGGQVKSPKKRTEDEIADIESELKTIIADKISEIGNLKAKLLMLEERKD